MPTQNVSRTGPLRIIASIIRSSRGSGRVGASSSQRPIGASTRPNPNMMTSVRPMPSAYSTNNAYVASFAPTPLTSASGIRMPNVRSSGK